MQEYATVVNAQNDVRLLFANNLLTKFVFQEVQLLRDPSSVTTETSDMIGPELLFCLLHSVDVTLNFMLNLCPREP
jgi:hypothetical protein